MKRVMFFVLSLPLGCLASQGCGGAALPPTELVNAREAVSRAQTGPANQLDPAQVHDAQVALARAERAYQDEPSAPEVHDLAIVAQLKAMTAEAQAQLVQSEQAKATALRERDMLKQAEEEAKRQEDLAAAQKAQATADKTRDEASQQQRAELAKRIHEAAAPLEKFADVKDSDRGVVITIYSDVLFKGKDAKITPQGKTKLDLVGKALKGVDCKTSIEGHTDASAGYGDVDLSERRADAVKEYLVSKGLSPDTLTSVGYGATRPLGDNSSHEGRTQNRRIEIVAQPREGAQAPH
jgi:flagellar motor protein MotB